MKGILVADDVIDSAAVRVPPFFYGVKSAQYKNEFITPVYCSRHFQDFMIVLADTFCGKDQTGSESLYIQQLSLFCGERRDCDIAVLIGKVSVTAVFDIFK